MDRFAIAFLDIREFSKPKGLRGGVLVTNEAVEPVEFRCTSVIQPTPLQKIFWGARMEGYITTELVGKPLLHALSNRVSLVVVRNPAFVEMRSYIDIPLVQVLRNEELINVSPLALEDDSDDMVSSIGGLEPVILKVHRDYHQDRQSARQLLAETLRSWSLLEPFDRITNALDIIHQQEAVKTGG